VENEKSLHRVKEKRDIQHTIKKNANAMCTGSFSVGRAAEAWRQPPTPSSAKVKERVEYSLAQLVEAMRYKPEGRGFDSRWSHWNFSVT
jgi:hypothetical protein